MRVRRRTLTVLGLLPLLACTIPETEPTLVSPHGEVRVEGMTVVPPIGWSRVPASLENEPGELWTVNGPALDELVLIGGLASGKSLVPRGGRETAAVFRSGMAPADLAELVLSSRTAAGGADVTATAMRQDMFGDVPGFRVEYRLAVPDGLTYRGLAVGAEHGGRLYLIRFEAPPSHYFPTYAPAVERLIASVRLDG